MPKETKGSRRDVVIKAMQGYIDYMQKYCGRDPSAIPLLPEQYNRVKDILKDGKYNGIPVKSVRG